MNEGFLNLLIRQGTCKFDVIGPILSAVGIKSKNILMNFLITNTHTHGERERERERNRQIGTHTKTTQFPHNHEYFMDNNQMIFIIPRRIMENINS